MQKSVSSEIIASFLIIGFLASCAGWLPAGSQEVTTYNASCKACKPSEMNLYRWVFRADSANSTVTSWVKDGGHEIFVYRNCAIRDKENWKCEIEDAQTSWHPEMRDGSFVRSPIYSTDVEMPWYTWWSFHFLSLAHN